MKLSAWLALLSRHSHAQQKLGEQPRAHFAVGEPGCEDNEVHVLRLVGVLGLHFHPQRALAALVADLPETTKEKVSRHVCEIGAEGKLGETKEEHDTNRPSRRPQGHPPSLFLMRVDGFWSFRSPLVARSLALSNHYTKGWIKQCPSFPTH